MKLPRLLGALVLIALASLWLTHEEHRAANGFTSLEVDAGLSGMSKDKSSAL